MLLFLTLICLQSVVENNTSYQDNQTNYSVVDEIMLTACISQPNTKVCNSSTLSK